MLILLKKIKKIWKFATDPYSICYAFYYFFYAIWVIIFPKKIIPPSDATSCRIEIGNSKEAEKNFLYAKIKPESKWKFYKRNFAFTLDNETFYKLPSFTPWPSDKENQKGETKFGLNHRVVEKYPGILKIITWI